MSFTSKLGKVLGAVGGFVPVVGPGLSALGSVLGGAAGGSADTAAQQGSFQQNRDQLLNAQYGTQQGAEMNAGQLDLQRKGFDLESESSRYKQALSALMQQNVQDVELTVPGVPRATVTGGRRPSALGQEGREIASSYKDRMLSELSAGNEFQGGAVLAPPDFGAVPKAGGNSALNAAALFSSALGALGKTMGQPQAAGAAPQMAGVNMAPPPQVGTPAWLTPPPKRGF